jgi:hypothetical protein
MTDNQIASTRFEDMQWLLKTGFASKKDGEFFCECWNANKLRFSDCKISTHGTLFLKEIV